MVVINLDNMIAGMIYSAANGIATFFAIVGVKRLSRRRKKKTDNETEKGKKPESENE